jgi:hypothetical protein
MLESLLKLVAVSAQHLSSELSGLLSAASPADQGIWAIETFWHVGDVSIQPSFG